jgi:hypothetical protein
VLTRKRRRKQPMLTSRWRDRFLWILLWVGVGVVLVLAHLYLLERLSRPAPMQQ